MRRAVLALALPVVLGVAAAPSLASDLPVPQVHVTNDDDMVGVGVSDGTMGVGAGAYKDGSGVCTAGLRWGGPYCITR